MINLNTNLAKSRVRWLFFDCPFSPIEVGLSVILAGFGVVLLNPWANTFAASPNAYAVMVRIQPDEMKWGFWMLVVGAAQLIAWAYDMRGWRSINMILVCMYWFALACALIYANPAGWVAFLYPLFFFASMWVFWRMGYDWSQGRDMGPKSAASTKGARR